MNRQDVHKASHCAWQIHYHVVFPVKYRRGLLDKGVVEIITQTAMEIQERYDIEFEQIGQSGWHSPRISEVTICPRRV